MPPGRHRRTGSGRAARMGSERAARMGAGARDAHAAAGAARRRRARKKQAPGRNPALSMHGNQLPGNDLLSHTLARAVPWALRGLTAVFGMGTGVSPSPQSPEKREMERTMKLERTESGQQRWDPPGKENELVKPNDRLVQVSSTPRSAYTSCLSTWSSSRGLQGYLISGGASRLDAFSGYPFRT